MHCSSNVLSNLFHLVNAYAAKLLFLFKRISYLLEYISLYQIMTNICNLSLRMNSVMQATSALTLVVILMRIMLSDQQSGLVFAI